MKTKNFISFLALSSSILVFSVHAGAQSKLGHISFDSLIRSMPEYDSAKKVTQNHYATLEKTMEDMQKEYQQKGQDFQSKSATMTELVKQTKEKELQDLGQRIQTFQQEAQGDLQKFNDSITRPMINKAKMAVNSVAKAHEYKYVFDTSSGVVLYYEPSDDLFAMVAEKLGIKLKK